MRWPSKRYRYRGWLKDQLLGVIESATQPIRCRLGRHRVKFGSWARCIHCGRVPN